MRLTGFSWSAPRGADSPPLEHIYLPIDDLTGILGANDSGKTRTLQALERTLTFEAEGRTQSSMLFAACGEEEFRALTSHALSDLVSSDRSNGSAQSDVVHGGRRKWFEWKSDGGTGDLRQNQFGEKAASSLDLDSVALDPAGGLGQQWARLLAGGNSDWKAILDEAIGRREPVIGLEADVVDGDPVWNLFWCLPPFPELDKELQSKLTNVGLRRSGTDPELWQEMWAPVDLIPFYRTGRHRQLLKSPVVVAPVGSTRLSIAPEPIALPSSTEDVKADIEWAIEAVVTQMRVAQDYIDFSRQFGVIIDHTELQSPAEPWLAESVQEGLSTVHPDALWGCQLICSTANNLLPRFISSRYEIVLGLQDPHKWATSGKTTLRIRDKLSGEATPSFSIDSVAAGHHLWLQFALLESTSIYRRMGAMVAAELESRVYDQRPRDEIDDLALEPLDPEPPSSIDAGVEAETRDLAELLDSIRTHAELTPHIGSNLQSGLEVIDPTFGGRSKERVDLIRGRIYLLDEPERHLHPRLQREVARWLADAMRSRGSQAAIATHSVAFMSVESGATYTYAHRVGDKPTIFEEIVPSALTHLDIEAQELGLNRGELMTRINVFLWVEGRHEEVILEVLFGEELRESGIAVIPLGGTGRRNRLLEAESLLRFTSAVPAVWFDNISSKFLAALKQDPDLAENARGDRGLSEEERILADLFLTARHLNRRVEVLGHPAADVFDLLDDGVIRETFPGYPGHRQAEELWREELARGRRAGERKQWLREQFGVSVTVDGCREVARRMRRQGKAAHPFREVVEACERLAVTSSLESP